MDKYKYRPEGNHHSSQRVKPYHSHSFYNIIFVMRSSHQLLALPVFAGIAAAGLCRPGTSSITTAIAAIETETSVNADTKMSLTQTMSFSAPETISATSIEKLFLSWRALHLRLPRLL